MTLKHQIENIVNAANAHGRMPYGEAWKAALVEIEASMNKLDLEAGKGLVVGRNIRFQVADGYANYIVLKILKHVVHVVHIPLLDGYSYSGSFLGDDGKLCISRQVVEKTLQWEDGMKKLFGKR